MTPFTNTITLYLAQTNLYVELTKLLKASYKTLDGLELGEEEVRCILTNLQQTVFNNIMENEHSICQHIFNPFNTETILLLEYDTLITDITLDCQGLG